MLLFSFFFFYFCGVTVKCCLVGFKSHLFNMAGVEILKLLWFLGHKDFVLSSFANSAAVKGRRITETDLKLEDSAL